MIRMNLLCLTAMIGLVTSASGQDKDKSEQGVAVTQSTAVSGQLPTTAALFQSATDLRAASESLERFGKSLEGITAEIGGTFERAAEHLAHLSSGFDPLGFQHAFKAIGQQTDLIRQQQAVIERLQQAEISRLKREIQQLRASHKGDRETRRRKAK